MIPSAVAAAGMNRPQVGLTVGGSGAGPDGRRFVDVVLVNRSGRELAVRLHCDLSSQGGPSASGETVGALAAGQALSTRVWTTGPVRMGVGSGGTWACRIAEAAAR